MTNIPDKRRSYGAPELIQYGKLESLTGALVCTNLANKVGTSVDDVTQYQSNLVGDKVCF